MRGHQHTIENKQQTEADHLATEHDGDRQNILMERAGGDPLRAKLLLRTARRRRENAKEAASPSVDALAIAQTRALVERKLVDDTLHTFERALLVAEQMARDDELASLGVDSIMTGQIEKQVRRQIRTEISLPIQNRLKNLGGFAMRILSQCYQVVDGIVDKEVDRQRRVTATEAMSRIVRRTLASVDAFCQQARATVRSAPDSDFVAIYRIVSPLAQVKSDDDDSDDTGQVGTLARGMTDLMLEKIGFPETGEAYVDVYAQRLYLSWREVVRSGSTAGEVADELTRGSGIGRLGFEAKNQAASTEEQMFGSRARVELDINRRSRAERAMQ